MQFTLKMYMYGSLLHGMEGHLSYCMFMGSQQSLTSWGMLFNKSKDSSVSRQPSKLSSLNSEILSGWTDFGMTAQSDCNPHFSNTYIPMSLVTARQVEAGVKLVLMMQANTNHYKLLINACLSNRTPAKARCACNWEYMQPHEENMPQTRVKKRGPMDVYV